MNIWIHDSINLFTLVKKFSVLFAIIYFLIIQHYKKLQKPIWFFIIYLFLFVNILEAVMQSYYSEFYVIMTAGILLLLGLHKSKSIIIDQESKYLDLKWDIPIYWIIGFTIWNYVFVYTEAPQYAAIYFATLTAPLIVAFKDNSLWLLARAYTLMSTLIIHNLPINILAIMESPHWQNEQLSEWIQWIALISNLLIFIYLTKSKQNIFRSLKNSLFCPSQ